MRRYLVDPINDHRAGVDMAHCYCGVPCLSGTHPTFPIYHPNSWKSYHFPTAKELYPLCSHPMA